MDDSDLVKENRPILHVLVLGFHHKKGCQVEYSYPPLIPGGSVDSTECPPGWKYLPTLALPDGSHNYDHDAVFFNLPALHNPNETVFGISCFKQIPVEKLKNRTADITRGTVQKSVCVLSRVPLYGHIQVKMELITHAYFDEGDFTKVSILQDTYHHLTACLQQSEEVYCDSEMFVGLSARDLIMKLRHKVLLLYKLLLLERKILFFHSPVEPLCSSILTLLSLQPNMLEKGLFQSACVRPSRPMSPVPEYPDVVPRLDNPSREPPPPSEPSTQDKPVDEPTSAVEDSEACEPEDLGCGGESRSSLANGSLTGVSGKPMSREVSMDLIGDACLQDSMAALAQIDASKCGLPLTIFTEGYLCLPYLSLPYMDLLSDKAVRGYVIGATNVLFKQKKNLVDVLVELESGRIESCSGDLDLKRAVSLTTEDLRFAEYLVRHVSAQEDHVGWEGSEEWVRAQFHAYTLTLLRTSLLSEGCREFDQFNKWFMALWINTRSYQEWRMNTVAQDAILEVNPGHPFTGQLSVQDMKLRLAHTIQTTEGGRKLNQAMQSTGRVMATTGRAVGGALTQAKGALSTWWSSITAPQPPGLGLVPEEGPPPKSRSEVEEAEDVLEPQPSNILTV